MNAIQWSIVCSALLRLTGVAVCWELQVKLGKNRKSYPTAPVFAPMGFFVVGAILAANVADLCARATVRPPNPLLSGYALTIAILIASAIGHYWLQASWLPASVQQAIERRAAAWRGGSPCFHFARERRRKDRMRAKAKAAEEREAIAAARARTAAFLDQGGPVHDGLDQVIPASLRGAP